MFNLFRNRKKEQAQEPPLWLELFDTQPKDSQGSLIALDDLVSFGGKVWQVVAMSHKGKVVLRKVGKTSGGFWRNAEECEIVKRHERKEN